MRTVWTVVITAAVALAVAGGIGWWLYSAFGRDKAEVPTARLEAPSRGELIEVVRAPGRVRPKSQATIRAPFAARIVELACKEGDRVSKADPNADPPVAATVLARVEPTGMEGTLRALLSPLRLATQPAGRAEKADETAIVSPIDGVVALVAAEAGQVLPAGAPIVEVADFSQMLVTAGVDESDVGAVREGQRAVVRIRAYGDEAFGGVVESVALSAVGDRSDERFFPVKVLLDETDKRILAGLTADVEIQTRRHEDVLKVPTQAVLGRRVDELPAEVRAELAKAGGGETWTMVVYRWRDGKAVVTPVAVGASDETHTIIESGLAETDRVITGPYKVLEKLKHDQKVEEQR